MFNQLISSNSTTQKQVFKNILLEKWDQRQQRFIQTEIIITITQDKQITYFSDGRVLRTESIQEDFNVQEILANIEQLKHLQWQGGFEQNNKKTGSGQLNGMEMLFKMLVGTTQMDQRKGYGKNQQIIIRTKHRYMKQEYMQMAKKEGLGCIFTMIKRLMVDNTMSKVKDMVNGENQVMDFMRNLKSLMMVNILMVKKLVDGIFSFKIIMRKNLNQCKIIIKYYADYFSGGGLYNERGQGYKNGRSIELSNEFRGTSQITLHGQYKNGKKVGRWDIYWNFYGNNQKIGGGSYDEAGNEIKINGWIELSKEFTEEYKVTYKGEYQNGKQIGKWDVLFCGKKIGGGLYDQNGDGCKTGKWIESSELFSESSQFTYRGEYKNGKKVGRWDIFYFQDLIGGGFYDESGNGCKIGRWTELSDETNNLSAVKYLGDYKNGTKVGRWDIERSLSQKQKIIFSGGGSYDEVGIKFGKWVYFCDDFGCNYGHLNYIYAGEYKGGKKVGSWNVFQRGEKPMQYTVFGCGQYDEAGNECKIGRWIELSNEFRNTSQITFDGQYKNGKKVGRWDIQWHYQRSNKNIGGGLYDESGNECKIGRWIEISDEFDDLSQVTYHGDYRCGKKVGRWDIWYQKNYNNLKNEKIGGGSYDELGNECKTGKWTELNHKFRDTSQITYLGEYKNGKKIGYWETQFEEEQIGGGSYDEEGDTIKIGKWIELHDSFTDTFQTIYEGEFRHGQKVGTWIQKNRGEDHLDFRKVDVKKYDD
ncbi:unnamed protein product [Paramecium pentaurelia]|uniref:Uncharacterized protein n=1 Tax=Paramecium pentaurelia TaxID=43138 RepID=A0A8S1YI74_9CILI|nr:unnamed protein product [Paramecium pentaurelia]